MDEAVRIVKEYFEKKCKVTPGIIAGLHTFGSRMNFNPHVHMLVTMGGMKRTGVWKSDYEYKGEVCLKDGNLQVKYAKCSVSKACLERMITDVIGVEETKARQNGSGYRIEDLEK